MENPRPSTVFFVVPVLLALSVPACSSVSRISGAPAVFRPPTEVARYPGAVTRVSFSPDGRRLAAGGPDNAVRVYRVETWDEEGTVGADSASIRDVGWSPAGDRLAVVTNEGLHVYVFPSGKEVRFIGVNPPPGPGGPTVSVADPPDFLWSPGGDRIALSGFDDAGVRVYSGVALEDEVVLKGHYKAVTSMTWDMEGRLYTASWDGTVRRWDAATGKWEFLTPNLGPGGIRLAWLDSIGALATMVYGDLALHVWDMRVGTLREKVMCSPALALFRASRDARMAAIADTYNSVSIRDVPGWKVNRVLASEGIVLDLRWSPDGRHLAGRAAGDAAVTVWDVATGGAVRLWTRDDDMISMDWSPDGRRLITGGRKGKIREWTLAR